jgi:ADP-ribose pyrophosphatase YjhB (NUDIX family)
MMTAVSCFACVFNDRGEVLCMRATEGNDFWSLPGGELRAGESVADTIEREVREGSGYFVAAEKVMVAQSIPGKSELVLLVHAYTLGRGPWQPNETIAENKFFQPSELPEKVSLRFGEYLEQSQARSDAGRIVTVE